jgi:acylphosphatase
VSKARRFVVRGRVQGVGFRYFVLTQAREIDLNGFTRNLADGTVEVQAAGTEEALERLSGALAQGPPQSRVDGVVVENLDAAPDWDTFRITH